MAGETVQRRLAAILAADVVEYSRLMGTDEVGTLEALKAHRRALLDPTVAAHHGRIVKTTGDGALVEFASVVDAVGCAVVMQRGMLTRNASVAENQRIVFRIGINVGDIIFDGDDIFGDGVNIAARLEAICEPGGICISRAANDQIRDKLSFAFADLGEQTVKNISRAVGIFGLASKEIEALPEPELAQSVSDQQTADIIRSESRYEQEIQFCITRDGVQLAYSRMGGGPQLVKTGNWMTHLEFDFQSPIWRHLYRELSRDHTLIRYDTRGNGLSDRDVENVSFETFVGDLESVVDHPRTLRTTRHFSGMRSGDRLRSTSPRACHRAHPIWRIRGRLGKARSIGRRKGASRRNADPGASGLGSGESGFPPAFHVAIHSGRDQGAGRLVQCASTDVMLARRRGAELDRNRRHRCEAAAIPDYRPYSCHACTRRCSRTVRSR